MIDHGLRAMKKMGLRILTTYGVPDFYAKVGFQPLLRDVIAPPFTAFIINIMDVVDARVQVTTDPETGLDMIILPQAPNPNIRLKNIRYGIFFLCCLLLVIPGFLFVDLFFWEGFAWETHLPASLFCGISIYFLIKQLNRFKTDPVPEKIVFKERSIEYDSGIPVLVFNLPLRRRFEYGNRFYYNRNKTEFGLSEIRSLKIRTQWFKRKLFITKDHKPREIGMDLSDPEREWLLEYIKNRYQTP